MKKLSLILILAAVILGIYGCGKGDSPLSPEETAMNAYKKTIETPFEDGDFIYYIDYNYNDGMYYMTAGTSNSIVSFYRSSDGITWEIYKELKDYRVFYDFAFEFYHREFRIGRDGYIYFQSGGAINIISPDLSEMKSILYPNAWCMFNPWDPINIDNEGVIYSGVVYKSTDKGETWAYIKAPFDIQRAVTTEIVNNKLIVDAECSFWISEDKGETWTKVLDKKNPDSDSIRYFYDIEKIADNKPGEYKIKIPVAGEFEILNINNDGKIVANWTGYTEDYLPGEYDHNCNIHTSADNGETWDFQFCLISERQLPHHNYEVYYTKSGYVYTNTLNANIFNITRNKTPIK